MNSKLLCLALMLLLAVQTVAPVWEYACSDGPELRNPEMKSEIKRILRHDNGLIISSGDNVLRVEISNIQLREGVEGGQYPGRWHNTSYNYRINITVTEPAGYSRTNWPVDVYIEFNPWASRQGIRLLSDSGHNIIFQIWNSTGNGTHIRSATITFLATIGAGSTARYYLYYDTRPVGRPIFPTQVTLSISTDPSTGQPIYTIVGQSYSKVVLAPGTRIGTRYIWTGGRILEITEASTNLNLYTPPMNDIGIARNPSLANPFGNANATGSPESRFVDTETQNGPIFILYRVINSPVYDTSGTTIAKANFTYKFFAWGWLVEAYVRWLTSDAPNSVYWIGAYSFDQDDGADVVYDRVATPTGTVTLGEGLPWTKSGVNPDWGREDLTNNLRAFITPVLVKNRQYRVQLTWTTNVDLDVFIYSERGFLIEGYDNLWDKLDGFVVSQDYTEDEVAVATENERWIIVVLAYCSEGLSTSFTVTVTDTSTGQTIATFSGSFASGEFIYTSRYSAYCNRAVAGYPTTIDTTKEGNVGYTVSGWAKRYFADNELLAFILPMPRTGGDDYFVRLSWNLEYSKVHYHIYLPDGTEWTRDVSGSAPPLTRTLIPTTSGNFVILVHYYDGSYYDPDDGSAYDDITVELYFEPPFAETEDYEGSGSWNWVAFYHGTYSRSIGFVNISLEMNLGGSPSRSIYWGNKGEGPSTDEDYILWAIRISGVSAVQGNWIRARYAVILAAESGSSTVAHMAPRLRAPLLTSLAQTERFTLLFTCNITDGDYGPVVNAHVVLLNKTSRTTIAAGYTDWSGVIVFDVPRYKNYTLNITLASAYNVYRIVDDLDLSVVSYTTFSISRNYQFPDIVRVVMQCNDTEKRILQGALIRFNETVAYAYTNLTGHLDVYIRRGIWNITVSYRFGYDSFNLTYANKTPVKDIYGDDILMVRWALVNITKGQRWILIDLDAAAPPPLRIELREGSYSYDVYWGENVRAKVAIVSDGNLVNAADNVTWKVVYAANGTVVAGFDVSKMTRISLGIYGIDVSTYGLPAGEMYYLIIDVNATIIGGRAYFIDAYGNRYQRPQPLLITLRVVPRPTKIVVTMMTSTIYWDEGFEVRLYFQDALNNDHVLNADVSISFLGPAYFEGVFLQRGIEYIFALSAFKFPTGAYMVTVTAAKGNYSKSEYIMTLIVNPRPTELFGQTYLEIPWQVNNYDLLISYNDSRRRVTVINATTRFEIINPVTQELLVEGSLIETTSGYIFSIPVYQLGVGRFIARIYFSKTYYEEKSFSVTIVINLRKTFAVANATSVSLIWGTSSNILVSYYDSEVSPMQKIPGAVANYRVMPFGEDNPVWTGELERHGSDYLLILNFTQNLTIGNYRIIVTLFKENYVSQSLEIFLAINPVPTIAIASASSIDAKWGSTISLTLYYNRTDTYEGIAGATIARFEIYYNGTLVLSGNLVDYMNGKYGLTLDTRKLVNTSHPYLGTYVLYIFLGKPNFEERTLVILVTINPRDTYVEVSATSATIEYGEKYIFEIRYIDIETMELIEATTRSFIVVFGDTIILHGELAYNPQTKTYYLIFDGAIVTKLGTYLIYIILEKQFYRLGSRTVLVTVTEIRTLAYAQPRNISVIWGQVPTIELYYVIAKNGTIIPYAYVYIISTPETPEGAINVIFENNRYVIIIRSSLLNVNTHYLLNITLSREFHEKKTVIVDVVVLPIPTYLVVSQKDLKLEYGERQNITVLYLLHIAGETQVIGDAEAVYVIYYGGEILHQGIPVFDSKIGAYIINIDTVQIIEVLSKILGIDVQLPVSIRIEIFFSKPQHQEQQEVITAVIDRFSVEITAVREPPQSVTRIQFIDEHKITEVEILIRHKGIPVEDAIVLANVSSVEAGIFRIHTATKVGPGLFRISIDWGMFPPGYKWEIVITIKSVRMYDREIPAEELTYDTLEYVVAVDYLFGSTRIYLPGIGYVYIANMFLYPMITMFLLAFAYSSYKLISWWLLPWQVKEIIRILKLIEKGVFKYEAPDRKEYIVEMLRKELK